MNRRGYSKTFKKKKEYRLMKRKVSKAKIKEERNPIIESRKNTFQIENIK